MPKMISQETLDRVLPLYKVCSSYAEVADKLGISISTVGKVVRESGYDRYHVGGAISKGIPASYIESISKGCLHTTARTVKLKSDVTGFVYTVSTETDIIEIESDTALMQISTKLLTQFMNEIKDIQSMIK